MSEGIALPPLARGVLLAPSAREARLDEALPQIEAAVAGETDEIAVLATLACLLWETLVQTNWCGFYRVVAPRLLAVGPYHGTMGCLRIPFERGVCGAAARERAVQRVPDVHAFAGHIACDDRTRSELVIPYAHEGLVRGVLDLDAPQLDAFSPGEAARLEGLLSRTLAGVAWPEPARLVAAPPR